MGHAEEQKRYGAKECTGTFDTNARELTWSPRAKPRKIIRAQHGLKEHTSRVDEGMIPRNSLKFKLRHFVFERTCVLWLRLQRGPFLQKPRA